MNNTNTNGIIFAATSIQGVRIILEENTYINHVLVRHPEMKDNIDAIKECVVDPLYILESYSEPKNKLFITKTTLATYPKLYLKAIVNSVNPRIGYVRTAHFEKGLDITKEGTIIYEKN